MIYVLIAAQVALATPASSAPTPPPEPFVVAQARTCKAVSSCREAVILWCSGYTRADGDNDGIPCENVCRSIIEVDAIRSEIGC